MNKRNVIFGILGSKLDRPPKKLDRWQAWRPTVNLCRHEDFVVDQLELFHPKSDDALLKQVVADIGTASPETLINTHPFGFDDPWDFEQVYSSLYDFARNYDFDVDRNQYLVHITTGTHVQQICMFILTESRHFPGSLLQTSPPKRREKDLPGHRNVIDLDLSRYDAIANRFHLETEESHSYLKSGIATRNKKFNSLIAKMEKVVVRSRSPVLLSGPTGAGKSNLARKIFELKKIRKLVSGELVEVNCATLRGDQAMSTLFGHVKGAFTGAEKSRKGLLQSANEGVLFLDEIGELGLDEQAMLLRAIEEKKFQPVGSDSEFESDFQLIAGTNRDLKEQVATGNFREDLLARIDLWNFVLPGLADRREDIEPNLDFELEKYAVSVGTRIAFNKEAREAFLRFALSEQATWTANFRDLNAAIVRMGTLADQGRINLTNVKEEIVRLTQSWSPANKESNSNIRLLDSVLEKGAHSIDLFDQVQLAEVIAVCQQSKSLSDAGRKLFSVSRTTRKKVNDSDRLRKYLAKFGISWKDL